MIELKSEKIEFEQGQVSDLPVSIIVREANAVQGMRRNLLRSDAFKKVDGEMVQVDDDPVLRFLRLVTYPDCVGAAVSYEGMEAPTFEEFCSLKSAVVDLWAEAAYRVNPSWSGRKQEEPTEDDTKKATGSGSK